MIVAALKETVMPSNLNGQLFVLDAVAGIEKVSRSSLQRNHAILYNVISALGSHIRQYPHLLVLRIADRLAAGAAGIEHLLFVPADSLHQRSCSSWMLRR